MKVYIISNNDHFHCADDEQHIAKIFLKKEKAEQYQKDLEHNSDESYDLLEWDVEE